MVFMRMQQVSLALGSIAVIFMLTGCQPKKSVEQPAPVNQQITAELPSVQMKPVNVEDPSTYPPENFITLTSTDGAKIGDAYRTYLQNKFVVKLAVTLTNANEQYTAYLIHPTSKKFIPLGTLTEKNSKWVVDTSSDRDGKEFTHLVVVRGKDIIDPDKGTLVASGDFRN
jgi:hypothetical protein